MIDLTSASTGSASTTSSGIDTGSHFYIHSSDSPGAVFVPVSFNGTGFHSWRRSVLRFLSVKNKLVFINGECKRPDPNHSTYRQWVRCDDMVTSWILNSLGRDIAESVEYVNDAPELWTELEDRYDQTNGAKLYQTQKEINDLNQGILDITTYYTRMKKLWEEMNNLCVLSQCNCVCECGAKANIHKAEQDRRLIQFLMGLNVVRRTRGNSSPTTTKCLLKVVPSSRVHQVQEEEIFKQTIMFPTQHLEGDLFVNFVEGQHQKAHNHDQYNSRNQRQNTKGKSGAANSVRISYDGAAGGQKRELDFHSDAQGNENISITKEQYDQVAYLLNQFQDSNSVADPNDGTCGAVNFADPFTEEASGDW
ncbi:hypothetical protein KY290_022117 [Solanum tuberosum]|uniref:Retrotransposon Copia-like N-terminal domain-containing protein n=1 Tax=Solanum tuberosum TaxID=4113 RepID=A0ABQ7V3G8_SOLTU|nr:hypothetical protein KY289_021249 [Solanum tuberosum]KAH0758624.1 hypothetical protein KY290_022117 [Solanum tuberosum]